MKDLMMRKVGMLDIVLAVAFCFGIIVYFAS